MQQTNNTIPDSLIQQKALQIEQVFQQIYLQRMADMPLINQKLSVQSIGFQQWQKNILGILVTPWFMNIMLLPGEDKWDSLHEKQKITHCFPSGKYVFIVGFEAAIGYYQMCSLFSPMFEFADQDAAQQTATIALQELMNQENRAINDINTQQIQQIWQGEAHQAADAEQIQSSPSQGQELQEPEFDQPVLAEQMDKKMNKSISRRQLLRRSLLLDNPPNNKD